jgi:hypothetical protein
VTEADGLSVPAAAVNTAPLRAGDFAAFQSLRMLAFGYDMDNMKARGWSQSEMPPRSRMASWTRTSSTRWCASWSLLPPSQAAR